MFARLGSWFDAFFLGYATRISGDLAVALVPIALALVTVYIGIYGLAVMRGEAPEPIGTFAWKMVKVFAILSFALPGLYYSGNIITGATGLQDSMATLFVAPSRRRMRRRAFAALDAVNVAANEQLRLLWADAGITRLDLVTREPALLDRDNCHLPGALAPSLTLLAKLILGVRTRNRSDGNSVSGLQVNGPLLRQLAVRPAERRRSLVVRLLRPWACPLFVSEQGCLLQLETAVPSLAAAAGDCQRPGSVAGTYLAVMVLLGIILYQSPSLASSLTGGASIQSGVQMASNTMVAMRAMGGGRSGSSGAGAGSAGGSIKPGGGAAFAAGRGVGAAANAVGTVGNAVASGARAAYQRVAQRGNSST